MKFGSNTLCLLRRPIFQQYTRLLHTNISELPPSYFEDFSPPNRQFDVVVAGSNTLEGYYNVLLKDVPIRNPVTGHILELPSMEVSNLLALEWNASALNAKDFNHSRPITSLAFRASSFVKEANEREGVILSFLRYLETDTLCFREPLNTPLGKFEYENWQPIVDSISSVLSSKIVVNQDNNFNVLRQEPLTVENCRKFFEDLSPHALAAMEKVIHDLKSVILGIAFYKRLINEDQAIKACFLELFWQAEKWGLVEDVHELEIARIKQNLTLSNLFFLI